MSTPRAGANVTVSRLISRVRVDCARTGVVATTSAAATPASREDGERIMTVKIRVCLGWRSFYVAAMTSRETEAASASQSWSPNDPPTELITTAGPVPLQEYCASLAGRVYRILHTGAVLTF